MTACGALHQMYLGHHNLHTVSEFPCIGHDNLLVIGKKPLQKHFDERGGILTRVVKLLLCAYYYYYYYYFIYLNSLLLSISIY